MLVKPLEIPRKKLFPSGLNLNGQIYYQRTPGELIKDTLNRDQGLLNNTGALVIKTGKFTGRSPKDRFIVRDELTDQSVDWRNFNIPIDESYFEKILLDTFRYLNSREELWVRDAYACAAREYRLNIRVINELPWMNLFVNNLFFRPEEDALRTLEPDWHILSAPGLELDPSAHGTRQKNATIISFKHRTIIICGSSYTGEIKKSVFSVLNYLLPQKKNVLTMHCAANVGKAGDTALFFGLSGTGKTTLSTDPDRLLIGDDEHGWDHEKIFNFEGGCYAKCINLSQEKEPEIYNAVKAGSLVENVTFYPGTNEINFSDASITENTRVAYPISFVENIATDAMGGQPKNVFFLTCDAYGVLPPIARLTREQALYYFISGYTAKIAGTETGITEPKATFSACFGAPFLPLSPGVYASLLGERIAKHNVTVWMINTGWIGGVYGTGKRISLAYSRAMIKAALNGGLETAIFHKDPIFGLMIPKTCPSVDSKLLDPRKTWQNEALYDLKAKELAQLFIKNFKYFEGAVYEAFGGYMDIEIAGPKI